MTNEEMQEASILEDIMVIKDENGEVINLDENLELSTMGKGEVKIEPENEEKGQENNDKE